MNLNFNGLHVYHLKLCIFAHPGFPELNLACFVLNTLYIVKYNAGGWMLLKMNVNHDYLGVRQIENVISVSIQSHDIEAGCTLAKTYGIELALPLRPNLPVDSVVQVSVRSSDIALSRNYLAGISIQNQIKGRICALVSMGGSIIVQIDCGNTMLAGITHRACRDMALQEGDTVYCLVKAHSFCYLPIE